ncbi:MAG: hypothetical protein HUJ94_00145 [Bacteroidales bacterium]|nr:hypothetical protein [Bacteroidales bacterium]
MKRLLIILTGLALVAGLALITGCEKVDNGYTADDTPEYDVVFEHDYTADEYALKLFGDGTNSDDDAELAAAKAQAKANFLKHDAEITAAKAEELGTNSSPITTYRQAKLSYTSIDENGEEIKLSGLVAFQTWRDMLWLWQPVNTVNQVLIENHFTVTANKECPTETGTYFECALYTLPGVVISADFEGYGDSRDRIHPYLNGMLTARQQVDFIKVALDYISTQGKYIKLEKGFNTYSIGYSQGGAVTLAVQKYLEKYELDFAKKINFRGSICGAGPYDMVRTYDFYRYSKFTTHPGIFPLIVKGMMVSHPDLFVKGVKFENYFTKEFLAVDGGIYESLAKKEITLDGYSEILEKMDKKNNPNNFFEKKEHSVEITSWNGSKVNQTTDGWSLDQILSAEALDPASIEYLCLVAALSKENLLRDWTPKQPVYFYHCEYDTVVPICTLFDLKEHPYANWPTDRYAVEASTLFGTDHVGGGYKFMIALIAMSDFEDTFKGLRREW